MNKIASSTVKYKRYHSVLFNSFQRYFSNDSVGHPKEQSIKESAAEVKEPFAKNLFLGKFDLSVLEFPEVLDNDRLETLEDMVKPISKFFEEKVDSKQIDEKGQIPEETMQALKDLGLFGLQAPEKFGGLDLNATECTRIAEFTSLDGGIAVTLAAHQSIGYKGILLFGTEEQKAKYIPKVATGENIAAFCLTEPLSGSDAGSITTRARLNEEGTHYLLNGSKIWISNGGTAEIFTVFAKTEEIGIDGMKEDKVTAFIVERAFGGISNGKPEDKLGIRGSNTCEVYFENTPVPVENVIGEPGKGFKVAMNILNSGRFSMGGSIAGVIKYLMKSTTDYAINREQFKTPIKDFDLIQEKFCMMTVAAYAMESMSYLTAGLIDSKAYPDCSVEAAIVKVFSSEYGFKCVNECLQVLGGMGYTKYYPHERYMRDGRIAHIFEGTNEILRLFISLSGLQHISSSMSEMVKKLKNPVTNVRFVCQKAFENMRNRKDKPKLDIDIGEHLHPTLMSSAMSLEYSVKRLAYAIETSLVQYGLAIRDEQLVLKRIADVVIDIYGMTAVLSRSSRSYCIGLKNADVEIRIANLFCAEAGERIKKNINEILDGPVANLDFERKAIAESVFKYGGYFPEHPLTKNW